MPIKIELLAPGGDVDSIKAAIAAGADAVYCGLGRFNARNRAENLSFEQLQGILHLAHKNGCQVFLTLNVIVVEPEIVPFAALLNKLCNTGIDGIIVQDLGMIYLIDKYFPSLPVHASTQLTTHSSGQIDFLSQLGIERVNLSRELNMDEIRELTEKAHSKSIKTEVFVHGSNCLSFSGLCYISSVLEGKSGNRGRCSQPCRDQYQITAAGNKFPFNLKDNSAFAELNFLGEAGVDSLKIEGRIKKFHYVYTVVKSYQQQLARYYHKNQLLTENESLFKVFNREFTKGFLTGNIHRDMFIDNPRDNSALHLAKSLTGSKEEKIEKAKRQLYDEKTDIIVEVRKKIEQMSISKIPLSMVLRGTEGSVLEITIQAENIAATIKSSTLLHSGTAADNTLNRFNLEKLFRSLADSKYEVPNIHIDDLEDDLQLPFRELTTLKRAVFSSLHGSKKYLPPITLPRLKNKKSEQTPVLAVLISNKDDLHLTRGKRELFYELPACLEEDCSDYTRIFQKNPQLTPWFPAVIIGEHFTNMVHLLDKLQPPVIVTNNSGIAFEANRRGIPWIAGPFFNIVNSYSLLCLKEEFHCAGAFVSNELSNYQIKTIKKPAHFKLYYSLYHPITLMTSRQCLFHQVSGCDKDRLTNSCLKSCCKSEVVRTQQSKTLFVTKKKGHYHTVYHSHNFLNTDIVTDITNMFDSFLIDVRDIKTETEVPQDKEKTVRYFERFLEMKDPSGEQLKQHIYPTTNRQYTKGI